MTIGQAASNRWLALGATLAGVAVALGAFGAHGLQGRLSEANLATFDTAARYQMYHSLGLIAVGLFSRSSSSRLLDLSAWAFLVGILLFSGSLYALTLARVTGFGLLAPFGGLAFITGWGLLAAAAVQSGRKQD